MATARPTVERELPASARRSPIGEVHILVYDWKPGQAEIQVRFPDSAVSGQTGAAAKQQRFQDLVLSQLTGAFDAFRERA